MQLWRAIAVALAASACSGAPVEAGLFFPTWEAQGGVPTGIVQGLLIKEDRCLFVEANGQRTLVLWEAGLGFEDAALLDAAGDPIARVGEEIHGGGGYYGQRGHFEELAGEPIPASPDPVQIVHDRGPRFLPMGFPPSTGSGADCLRGVPIFSPSAFLPSRSRGMSARLWRETTESFELERFHVELLERACRALDTAIEAEEICRRDGLIVEDRFGQRRPRPGVAIARDARLSFVRLLREIDLEGVSATDARVPRR